MADQIQTIYPLGQERGQIGSLSRPLAPNDADQVVIAATGAGMKPGQAFKFDGSGEAIPLTDLADAVNAEGILGFQVGQINQPLAGGINNTSGVAYAEADKVKYWRQGYVYVIAGGAVTKGAEIGFNPATGKYTAQAGTKMIAAQDAILDGVLEVILRASV